MFFPSLLLSASISPSVSFLFVLLSNILMVLCPSFYHFSTVCSLSLFLKHCPVLTLSALISLSECVNAFALVVHPPTEQENLLFSFQLAGEETVKSAWLRLLCRHVANTICKADAVRRHTRTERKADSLTYLNDLLGSSGLVQQPGSVLVMVLEAYFKTSLLFHMKNDYKPEPCHNGLLIFITFH